MNNQEAIPIACSLSSAEQKQHTETYRSGVFSHVKQLQEREGGYSLRFDWAPERIRELGEFLALDSSCCAFLDHSLEIPRGKHVIWLHLTGTKDAASVLAQELKAIVPKQVVESSQPTTFRAGANKSKMLGSGLASVGILGVLCCIAPTLALTGFAASTLALMTSFSTLTAMALAFGLALLALAYHKRPKRRACCNSIPRLE